MGNPAVTILVPIYNGSAYLRETLASLLSQTFADFELLAIDDGSTDGSSQIVEAMNDRRVRLIRKENAGLCHTLNLGIAEASAPYIARSDQDDVSFPDRLKRQHEVMEAHPEAVGLFGYSVKTGGRHRWANADKVTMAPGQTKEFEPMRDGCMLCSTMFVRTAVLRAIGGFRQAYYPVDDWDMELRLTQAGKVLIVREPLIVYRFHANANTYRTFADMSQKTRWAKQSYLRRAQSLPELSFEEFRQAQPRDACSRWSRYRKDSSKLHMRMAGQRFLDGRYAAGAGHLMASVVLNPVDLAMRLRRLVRNK